MGDPALAVAGGARGRASPTQPARGIGTAGRARGVAVAVGALRSVEVDLPPRSDPVWADPYGSSRLLQRYIAATVRGVDADEAGATAPGAALDRWQVATLLPLMRRRELLVLAPTGTGKSFLCANYIQAFLARHLAGQTGDGVAPPVQRIILAVRDETQLRDQFNKISTAQVYLRGLGRLSAAGVGQGQGRPASHISVGVQPGAKPVAIMTFVQLGHFFKNARGADRSELLVIVDEVHELCEPNGVASIVHLNKVLDRRVKLPYDERFLLVGMTATPPTGVPAQLARLLSWFTPRNYTDQFRADKLLQPTRAGATPAGADAGGAQSALALPAPSRAARVGCDLPPGTRPPRPLSLGRFLGLSLFVYSVDRNRSRYAAWSSPDPVVLLVPTERTLTITGRRGRGAWTRKDIDGHSRGMGARFAQAAVGLLAADVKKTLVMLDGNAACEKFVATLRARPEMDQFTLLRLAPGDGAAGAAVEAAKTAFDRATAQSVVPVANRETYGVGHSFWATDESLQAGRGARRVLYTPSWDVSKVVQAEGRAKRRGTHSGYTDRAMRTIDRVVLVAIGPLAAVGTDAPPTPFPRRPVALGDPWVLYAARHAGLATCHVARLQLNVAERSASQRLFAALFCSALSAQLLWNWWPDAIGNVPAPWLEAPPQPVRAEVARKALGLGAAQRAATRTAVAAPVPPKAATAGLRRWWEAPPST